MTCTKAQELRWPIVVELNYLGLTKKAIAEVFDVSKRTIQTDFDLIGIETKSCNILLRDVLDLVQRRFDEIEKALFWPVVRERNRLLNHLSIVLKRYLQISRA